jgi:hypothetical protein
MKHLIAAFFLLWLAYSCKKDDATTEPAPVTPEVKTGEIKLKLLFYDSLGELRSPLLGQTVRLDAVNSTTVDANGEAVFKDIAYGTYFLSVVKDFWEGPPLKISHNLAQTTATAPFAAIAPWQAKSFTAQAFTKDSIVANFKLDRAVPASKQVKMALIAGIDNSLSGSNYQSLDIFFTGTDNVNQVNIAKFAAFKNFVTALDSGAVYFIKVLPVSYGGYASNVFSKNVLLGDNLFPPDNWLINKEWND